MPEPKEAPKSPDLSPFVLSGLMVGSPWMCELVKYAHAMTGDLGPGTAPRDVPWDVVESMGYDPMVRLAEAAASEPLLDPAVYYVEEDGSTPERVLLRATLEAWLWPMLPKMLEQLATTLAWGVVPWVFTWEMRDLLVALKAKPKPQAEPDAPDDEGEPMDEPPEPKAPEPVHDQVVRVVGHLHPRRTDTLFPGDVEVAANEEGDVVALRVGEQVYGWDRHRLLLWRDQFRRLTGAGSRRVAYRAWYTKQLIRVWRGRYLERSVDPPRIGYAPTGQTTNEKGEKVSGISVVTSGLLALNGGGSFVLPSTTKDNQPLYKVEVMDVPGDREGVWESALDYEDSEILIANKVPPAQVLADEATNAGARVPAEMFVEIVEGACRWVAAQLTDLVAMVHHYNRTDPDDPAPVIRSRPLPKTQRKLLLDVFNRIADQPRRLPDGREYTLAGIIHGPELVDGMGLRRVEPEDVATMPKPMPAALATGGKPGPDRKASGAREQRREDALTDEGEDATGAPGEGQED